MPRISEHAHLKPRAFAEFEKGLQPMDVVRVLRVVPMGTVYGWFDAYKKTLVTNQENRGNASGSGTQFRDHNSNLVKLFADYDNVDEAGISDFELARRTIRNIIRDRKQPGQIRIQACNALLKTLELRAGLKIKDDDEDDFIAQDLTELSDEDLQKMSSGQEAESA